MMATLPESTTTRMYRDIGDTAAAIAHRHKANAATLQALARDLCVAPPRFVATAARGSSDNAASYATYLIETQPGLATASAPPSLQSAHAVQRHWRDALVLAISQSGRCPDLPPHRRKITETL